jgi:hypothetical protein
MGARFSELAEVRNDRSSIDKRFVRCVWDGKPRVSPLVASSRLESASSPRPLGDDADSDHEMSYEAEEVVEEDVNVEPPHLQAMLNSVRAMRLKQPEPEAEAEAEAMDWKDQAVEQGMVDEMVDEILEEILPGAKEVALREAIEQFAEEFADDCQADFSPKLFPDSERGLSHMDYVHHFLNMKSISCMGDKMFDAHSNTMLLLLRESSGNSMGKFPSTLHRMKALLGVRNMWQSARHYCVKFHRMFPDTPINEWDPQEECGCDYENADGVLTKCTEKRFTERSLKSGSTLVPREWIIYLGVERLIKRWMAQEEFWKQRAQKDARDPKNADIWGGTHVQGMDQKADKQILKETPRMRPGGGEPVLERSGSMIEAGFDHFPVFGRGSKRYAHPKAVDAGERMLELVEC